MKERVLLLILVLLIYQTGCLDFEERHVESLILLSWDGVQRDHLYELLERGELSNLATLIEEGSIVDIEITDHLTDTKAGHTQMLTGYSPDETGVYSNNIFKPIPEGLTI
ncbi:MAG: alkaline phosphatase family protein, partial [Candidatus Methanofastidiosia archaeon]